MNLVSDTGYGGADRLALDLCARLGLLGHRVIWGCPSQYHLRDEADAAGLEIHTLDFSGNMDMTPLPAFMRFCKDEKIDIVNVHHSHGRHMLVAARLLGLKAKAVFTRHCISGSAPFVGALFYNLMLDMNIAVSNTVRKSLLDGGIWPRKVITVYGGVDIENFENVPTDKVRWFREKYARSGTFNIGIVARLGLYKGFRTDKPTLKRHEVFFKAIAVLGRDCNLLVLGTVGEKDIRSLKVIAQNNGLDTDKITFCGFQDDMAPFYQIMDLNVLPSPNEGLGLAIIEAMAAGVPCIGADSGGIREIITDGLDGYLFRSGNSEDLAEKIRIIMENKGIRDRFIARGKEKVRDLFAIDKMVRETEKLFYDLLD
jgi:glycosyltransferase involved in cell wall biosynthesis